MSIHNPPSPITEEMMSKLAISLQNAASGKRDPATMQKAIEEADRSREETRRRIGTVNVAVELIRETRDR